MRTFRASHLLSELRASAGSHAGCASACRGQSRPRPRSDSEAARRIPGRPTRATTRPPIQRTHAGEPVERQTSLARVGRESSPRPARADSSAPPVCLARAPRGRSSAARGPARSSSPAPTQIKGAVLQVNGVLYVTAPDNVWALDARDGHELWHYFWKTQGRHAHRQSRRRRCGATICFSSRPTTTSSRSMREPARNAGTRRSAPFSQQYFLTSAPMTIGNHIIVGTGNDLDSPGYLMSFDPETRRASSGGSTPCR